jgi:hypothetical protein
MIKFITRGKNGQSIVGLGLSEGNVERLKKNDPMYFSLDALGIEGVDIMIVYGETEESIIADFKRHGVTFGKEVQQ